MGKGGFLPHCTNPECDRDVEWIADISLRMTIVWLSVRGEGVSVFLTLFESHAF